MLVRCHVCRAGHRCPASVTLPWCEHSGMNAAFCTLFNGSDGIHPAYSAHFGPFLSRSNLHRSILGRFLQQYANCRAPVSRQAGDWCAICRRLVNHRSMDSLGKCRSMAGWHGFWTRTACMGVARQLRCGSRLRARPPPHWRDGRAERAGTVYCWHSSRPRAAAWRPLPLRFRTRSCRPLRITRLDIPKRHMRGRHALGHVIRGRSSSLTPWNRPHSPSEPICRFPERKLFSPIPVTTAYGPQCVIMPPIPPAVPQKPGRACSLSSCQRRVLPRLVLPHMCLPWRQSRAGRTR